MSESEIHRRIKYAIAKELVDMGYTAGVEVQREEGGIIDVQGRKGRDTINIEVWKTHIPEWMIVRVKEVIEPIPIEPEPIELIIEQQQKIDFDVLHGKPHSEISKLKLFIEIFNALGDGGKNDVSERNFIDELINTGKFTEDEAKTYLRKAMQNGQIFERKAGFYAKECYAKA